MQSGNPTFADGARLSAALDGRYRVDRQLGAGGMATVYLAHDVRHDREVAIKVLREGLAQSLGRERFVREIRLAARLNHPHILPLYDSGEAGAFLYFVMPVMRGQTLRDRLQRDGSLPVNDALRIASEVADALDYAHRHDTVHRDIKPENILLHEGHAIVADFGIGKALVAASAETDAAHTQIGVTVGTPAYMSPEQASGDVVDGRSDLFALGCVLYEMLTGRQAFSAATPAATIASRFHSTPPPITDSRGDVPLAVAQLVTRLLARSAADRHATGSQVVIDLRSSHATPIPHTPTPARPPAPGAKSIAVLPFANVSAEPENEFFSDGLTDEIITDLSGVKGLRLVSRNSSMQLKGSPRPLGEIARDLGVRYLLTGSVRKAGNALRITAQLVDPETDAPLWAEKYSGTMDDVFDVQERVSRAIVQALQVKLSSEEDARLGARRIRDPRAFELFLQARNEMRHYGVSLDRAATLLQRAIEIEGETPPLRALRAFMEFSRVRGGMHTDMRPLDIAESEARALIQQMPDAAFGYALLGFVGYERGDLPAAARHLTKAMELDPTDGDVMFFLCITLQAAGQIEPALRYAERFHQADPLSPFSGAMMVCGQWFAGNIGRHLEKLEHGLDLDPQNAILHWSLGYTYALMGRTDDAAAQAEWMRMHAPGLPYTAQLMSLVEAARGDADRALNTIGTVDLRPLDAHQTFHISESYAMAGDTSKALELLEFAVDNGMYPYRFYRDFCPFMQPLRGLPDFDRIIAKAEQRVRAFG